MAYAQHKLGGRILAVVLAVASGVLTEGRADAQMFSTNPGSWINYGLDWANWGIGVGNRSGRSGGASIRWPGRSRDWSGNSEYGPEGEFGNSVPLPPFPEIPIGRPPVYPGPTPPTIIYHQNPQPYTRTWQPTNTAPPPRVAPRKNTTPTPAKKASPPKQNTVKPKPVETRSNGKALSGPMSLTSQEAEKEIANRQENNEKAGEKAKDLVVNKAKGDPAIGKLGAIEQFEYLNALKTGDAQKAMDVLATAQKAGTIGNTEVAQLMEHVQVAGAIDKLVLQADGGHFDATDANQAVDLLIGGGYVTNPADQTALVDSVTSLHTNSALIDQLDNAGIGSGIVPVGGATIIASGGLGQGQMVLLGGGAVVIGTGNPQDGLIMGHGNAAQLSGMYVGVGDPVPDSQSDAVNDGVVLVNGGDSVVHYNVDGQPFSMQPGYRQKLPAGKTWTVEFDRGNSHGIATDSFDEGTYRFTPTESGWALSKHTYQATLDNSQGNFDFQYVLGNKQETLPAGQAVTFEHDYPLVIRFDDGRGNEQKKSLKSETYVIAMSPQGTLDLYESENVVPPMSIADVLPPSRPTTEEVLANPQRALQKMTSHEFTPNVGRSARAVATNRGSIFGGL